MSGLKLKISASIHGIVPSYKWLRSATSSPTARIPATVLSPRNLTISRGPVPVSLPPGRRIPPPPTLGQANLDLGFRLLRQTNNCSSHKCLSIFSSSDSDKQGRGSMASDSAKTDPFLNHDPHDEDVSPTPTPRDKPPASMPNADRDSSDKLLTLPTILTLGRVAAVPLLVSTFYVDSWWGTTATTSIFIAAAVTDWLDGYLARRMRLGSTFGAFLDPVADKLMVAATLVLLCTRPVEFNAVGQVPWLMTVPAIAIIGREITMSAVREWAASQGSKLSEAVAVNNLGKWKTATQMTALTILLATRDGSIGGQGLIGTGVALLYISAGLAVWSLAIYMKKISKVLLK